METKICEVCGRELPEADFPMGRKGIGFELKDSYFDTAVKNIKKAEAKLNIPTLF